MMKLQIKLFILLLLDFVTARGEPIATERAFN